MLSPPMPEFETQNTWNGVLYYTDQSKKRYKGKKCMSACLPTHETQRIKWILIRLDFFIYHEISRHEIQYFSSLFCFW